MEFLRFGSSIPGSYWGCCACCIIQNFKVSPNAPASIQLVSGDGGGPLGDKFAGPTYKDIFLQRIRSGTFDSRDMPNHAFLAILSKTQMSGVGLEWLAILKENGFEFIRTVNNSVWDVDNYVFGLFRNVGPNSKADQFTPPAAWLSLPDVYPEPWQEIADRPGYTAKQKAVQKTIYDKVGPPKFMTEKQLVDAGVPITLAGLRSKNPQELKTVRDSRNKTSPKAPDPFAPSPAATVPIG